jgi:hypothetical protein
MFTLRDKVRDHVLQPYQITCTIIVGFGVLTAVIMKIYTFWYITSCVLVQFGRRVGGTCRLYLQGRRVSQTRKQQAHAIYCLAYIYP